MLGRLAAALALCLSVAVLADEAAAVEPSECVGRAARRPANGQLVTQYYRQPLRVVRPDGSGLRAITRRGPYQDAEPAWSPNGRRVAFQRRQSLWIVDVATRRLRRLTNTALDSWPTWSPDGRSIAFLRGGRQSALMAIRPDGSDERVILPLPVGGGEVPSWSPNGRCIVIHHQDDAGQGLAPVSPEGGAPRFIYRHSYTFDVNSPPSWSPDGRHLLFAPLRAVRERGSVVRINVDGSGKRVLRTAERFDSPLYSPDGRTIAYNHLDRGVYLMRASGGPARLLLRGKFFAHDWGPRRR